STLIIKSFIVTNNQVTVTIQSVAKPIQIRLCDTEGKLVPSIFFFDMRPGEPFKIHINDSPEYELELPNYSTLPPLTIQVYDAGDNI
ncbi:hypothetical protein OFB84_31765, partial [Escherichia coli]|nr:hypothetical protein [Escherichia coli]